MSTSSPSSTIGWGCFAAPATGAAFSHCDDMPQTFRPHDLLWLADATALFSPDPLPGWLKHAWQPNLPVVVRRAPSAEGQIAVGIRGTERSQRCGLWADCNLVVGVATPESLAETLDRADPARIATIPALQTLMALAPLLDESGLAWGVTGSAGFELASGQPVLRDTSDLDLVICCPVAPPSSTMNRLLTTFMHQPCRVDAQLETPLGGVALAEWARAPSEVLVKTTAGPRLLADPWQGA